MLYETSGQDASVAAGNPMMQVTDPSPLNLASHSSLVLVLNFFSISATSSSRFATLAALVEYRGSRLSSGCSRILSASVANYWFQYEQISTR